MNHGRTYAAISIFLTTLLMTIATSTLASTKNNITLYTQTAESGTIIPQKNNHNQYQLILQNPNPKTTWFLDRPSRLAGEVQTTQFIANWNQGDNSFQKNNPNAALVYLGNTKNTTSSIQKTKVVKLSAPKYNQKKNQLTYTLEKLEGYSLDHQKIYHVALFIDSMPATWCIWPAPC